jgi:hypothetical protein
MFAWSHLDFFAIPVSISAVSFTSRQTWQNVISKEDGKEFKMYRKGKVIKKETTSGFCVCSFFFGEKFPTAEF